MERVSLNSSWSFGSRNSAMPFRLPSSRSSRRLTRSDFSFSSEKLNRSRGSFVLRSTIGSAMIIMTSPIAPST